MLRLVTLPTYRLTDASDGHSGGRPLAHGDRGRRRAPLLELRAGREAPPPPPLRSASELRARGATLLIVE